MTHDDRPEREHPLTGGHTAAQVVRAGVTVRRSPTSNSDFVARLPTYLDAVGVRVAPQFLGRDEQGRGHPGCLSQRSTDHPSQREERAYAVGGSLLRHLHDATAGHDLAEGSECVIHGDPGPYNAIFVERLPTVLIDCDSRALGGGCGT